MLKHKSMKYILKHLKTGEETICDKVTIDGFDYYVSDEFLRIGDYGYWEDADIISQISDSTAVLPTTKKVIATNNPNIDITKVVDEVERLAHKDNPLQKLDGEFLRASFKRGYNKAKETHPNSDDDMIEFERFCSKHDYENGYGKTDRKELLQLWKEQQIKTVYYEN